MQGKLKVVRSSGRARARTSEEKKKGGPILALGRSHPELFINRELSWLQFNGRVLEEAARKDNPLLERLKFLAISESNLNEFFMVRVAGLKQVVASAVNETQLDGRSPEDTLQEISRQVHAMVETQYAQFTELIEQLALHNILIIEHYKELTASEKKFVAAFWKGEVFPILTPLAIDPGHPFPHIVSGRLNVAVTLKRKASKGPQELYAVAEVPSVLPRFLELPRDKKHGKEVRKFIPLEEILKLHASDLFAGTTVKSMHGFTITRNSELSIDEVAADNLLSTIEGELKNRRWGEAVRLNWRKGMPDNIREFLRQKLDLKPEEMYERPGMLNLQDLFVVYNACQERKDLLDKPFIPKNALPLARPEKIFQAIRKRDILLHHPYDSFQTVLELLEFASRDPKTLAIKQTLYRTSGDSPVIRNLIQAAENGKQVTVLMELKARFDEANNIVWAREMEKHGVHVVYGLVGLKIHGKMLQIVRRENDVVRSYVHLSTGNYNPNTAKLYTDLAILTTNPKINDDITNLFHALTGYSTLPKLGEIAAAPINLRETLIKLVNREIANAEAGKRAFIRLKLNALVDQEMILLLYRASRAGVRIEMSVRGICCLRPGIKNVSENIRVDSVVGRFLEHSRILYFENGGNPKVFLSSADWMPRNLNRRIEILFPVQDPAHVKKLIDILDATFRDNHNARRLKSDGTWERVYPTKTEPRFSSQRFFREEVTKEFEDREKARREERRMTFQPMMNPERLAQMDTEAEEQALEARESAEAEETEETAK
ncbi:MAG: polyphosphate kinase 1 [Spirochaetia bacterium]|nr:polyphosphate kinase 1 [Spirochaetia bacterium]